MTNNQVSVTKVVVRFLIVALVLCAIAAWLTRKHEDVREERMRVWANDLTKLPRRSAPPALRLRLS